MPGNSQKAAADVVKRQNVEIEELKKIILAQENRILSRGLMMNPDTKEAMIEMVKKAAESLGFERLACTPEVETERLIARINEVTKFKVETIVQGFGCECGAHGAVQTKPEFVAQYCPICGKHFLAGTIEQGDR